MKKFWLLLLLPALAHADRLGALPSNADVLLTTQAVSGGGGGSSLEVMANGLRVSSPTASLNLIAGTNVTLSGALTGAATAAITINATGGGGATVLPLPGGATNYWNIVSTGPFPAPYGVTATSVTANMAGTSNLAYQAFCGDSGTGLEECYDLQGANLLTARPQAQMYGISRNSSNWLAGYGAYYPADQRPALALYATPTIGGTTLTSLIEIMTIHSGDGSALRFGFNKPLPAHFMDIVQPTLGGGTAIDAMRITAATNSTANILSLLDKTGTSVFSVSANTGNGAFNYGVSAGSMTGAGLSSCSGASNAVTWNSGTSLFGCNSGFLTGNQSITLSGDSTGSGTTAITVTAAALQPNITTLNAASGIAVVASTFNVNNVKMIWPSSGTVGNYLRYISTNVLSWDGAPAGGGGGITALTGDVTASGSGSVAATAASRQANINTLAASSVTVTGNLEVDGWTLDRGSASVASPLGFGVTYGATLGSATVNDLTASQIVVTDANKKLSTQSVLYSTNTVMFKCPAMDKLETNFAVNTATNTGTSNYLTCSFDNTTRQYVNGFFMVPSNLDTGGTITIRTLGRSSTGASSKNVGWILEHQPLANGGANSTTYLNSLSGALAVSATQGANDLLSWTMSVTSSTWAANNQVNFRFSRDVNVGTNLASPYYDNLITFEIPVTVSPSR